MEAASLSSSSDPPLRNPLPISGRLLRAAIQRAATAGAGWIQIREKDLDAHSLVELARFHHAEPLNACTRVLDAAGIPYRLSNDSLTSNVSMTMVAYNATCIVTVKEDDAAAARQALHSQDA